ncbi:SusD/RagB family nutrient-binding outer membrane lipoprotein [Seramator thermalis]|uniref:SusD/RagB family nutrient-binding outer membrane lipoprotein n=1 Tax=Seramator thermalis TaxID=2496270 RepID=UPI001EEEF138|nr:SusD/RagB family nutrient-binding outer membrane lipoprotein [Seramator thermalis]
MNTDPTRMQESNPGVFLNPVLYEVGSYNWSRYNGFTFHLMQSVVTTNNTGGLGWYYITDAAGDGHWNVYYRWLNNIREMEKQAVALNEPNYRAIAKTLKSWMYSILVDSFGDNPMSEATRGDERIFTSKFDKQIEVYKTILQDPDSANLLFDETSGLKYNRTGLPIMPVGDGVPTGNVMPRRFKYPAILQRNNMNNYLAAKENMGGDDFNILLIWQK